MLDSATTNQPDSTTIKSDSRLSKLREFHNPFDEYVAPTVRPNSKTDQLHHVPELNKDASDIIGGAIRSYHIGEAQPGQLFPPHSGVLVVLGETGAGKTHLVHILPNEHPNTVLVAPTLFEPGLTKHFNGYLLLQLVQHLQQASSGRRIGPLLEMADWFTGQVIFRALESISDLAWLTSNADQGIQNWWNLKFEDRRLRILKAKSDLIEKLKANPARFADICDVVCKEYKLVSEVLKRLALLHIRSSEDAIGLDSAIRKSLYIELIKLSIDQDEQSVFDFLFNGYMKVEGRDIPASNTENTNLLLSELVNLFLLCDRPVLFAFDALEELLGAPPEPEKSSQFFSGLAELVSSYQGIPVLVMAERGYWQSTHPYRPRYVQDRLEQGIPTRGFGSRHLFPLAKISADELAKVVECRMSSIHRNCGENFSDCPTFPFQPDDLQLIVSGSTATPSVRSTLQQLKSRYDKLVFGRDDWPDVAEREDANTEISVQVLSQSWQRELSSAKRIHGNSTLFQLFQKLYSGTNKWLEFLQADGSTINNAVITNVDLKSFDDHPVYGAVIECELEKDHEPESIAIAFLLGVRSGMPVDLEIKLKAATANRSRLSRFLIIWERDVDGLAHEHLPEGSRKIWDTYMTKEMKDFVNLKAVASDNFAAWLAVESWEFNLPVELRNEDIIKHFVAENTKSQIEIVDFVEQG